MSKDNKYKPFVKDKVTEKIGVYPGTFDPITNGHLDIVHRSLEIFDKVIIAIAVNYTKKALFPLEERLQMIRDCFPEDETRIVVDFVDGLLVDYAYTKGATAIIRGLRAVSDFDYEFQLGLMNRRIEREVETVFLMTGDTSGLIPDHVCEKLRNIYLT